MSVKLEPGREVSVRVPGRKSRLRVKIHSVTDRNIVVVDPRSGNLRNIHPDAVEVVHYKQKLRRS